MSRPREKTKGRVSDHVVVRARQYGSTLSITEIRRTIRRALDGEGDSIINGMFLLSRETITRLELVNISSGNIVEAVVNDGCVCTIKDASP